jgi:hypothetical protein
MYSEPTSNAVSSAADAAVAAAMARRRGGKPSRRNHRTAEELPEIFLPDSRKASSQGVLNAAADARHMASRARHRRKTNEANTEKRSVGMEEDEDKDIFFDAMGDNEDREAKLATVARYSGNSRKRRRTKSRRSRRRGTKKRSTRSRKIHTGPRGGRYYVTKGRKTYVS